MNNKAHFRIQPNASSAEAAAAIAAIEQFIRETTPVNSGEQAAADPWVLAARHEATEREPSRPTVWGEPQHWTS